MHIVTFSLSLLVTGTSAASAVPSLDLGLRELNAAGISAAELYDSLFDAALALGDDCGSAINQAAKLYIDDESCAEFLEGAIGFFSGFDFPEVELDPFDGVEVNLGLPVGGADWLSSFEAICTGTCALNAVSRVAAIDMSCTSNKVLAFSPQAVLALKMIRVFATTLCARDDAGELCLPDLVEPVVAAGTDLDIEPLFERANQDIICSPCSLTIQRNIFQILGGPKFEPFSLLIKMLCLSSNKNEKCTHDDLFEASECIAKAKFTEVPSDFGSSCISDIIGLYGPIILGDDDFIENFPTIGIPTSSPTQALIQSPSSSPPTRPPTNAPTSGAMSLGLNHIAAGIMMVLAYEL